MACMTTGSSPSMSRMPISSSAPSEAGPMSIVRSSSMTTLRIAVRTACQDVRVDKAMLPRWPTDPHLDKISCLDSSVKDELSKLAQGSRGPGAQGNHVNAASTYPALSGARGTPGGSGRSRRGDLRQPARARSWQGRREPEVREALGQHVDNATLMTSGRLPVAARTCSAPVSYTHLRAHET